jgi:hypothetical protein
LNVSFPACKAALHICCLLVSIEDETLRAIQRM